MYEEFYGLRTLPFAAKPAAGEYYFSENRRRILEGLETHIDQDDCVCRISGVEGVGKSALLQSLCARLGDSVNVFTIGKEAGKQDDLVDRLSSQLTSLSADKEKNIAVIKNADSLTPEDAGLLAAYVTDQDLQVILVVNAPDAALPPVLANHVVEHYTLLPFSPVETDTYIRVRLIQAGASPELFSASASEAVYHYSKGLPLLINRICDLALVYGFSRQKKQIDRQIMDFVLNDRWGGARQQADAATDQLVTEGPTSETPVSGVEARITSQLEELLRQGAPREADTGRADDRDIYDFIRLSMQYHQRNLERFTFGVVAVVVLLAVGGAGGFIAWQNANQPSIQPLSANNGGENFMVSGVKAGAVAVGEVSNSTVPSPGLRAGVARLLPSPVPEKAPPAETPVTEQAALETSSPPGKTIATPVASVAAENNTLQIERKKLERERRQLRKRLAAQRAENERLRQQSRQEHERVLKAQSLVEQARKSAYQTWDKINAATPDAFPEE